MPIEAGGVVTFFALVSGGGISVVRKCKVAYSVMLVNWV